MRRAHYLLIVLCSLCLVCFAAVGSALASTAPQEPEDDNPEYLLDIVTNQYSRGWREVWDGGDNRFRFRLGSNKVTQWFLEEELKLAAPLADRVRFRFHHARLYRYTTEEIGWDVLEFEGRVKEEFFFSLYARPTFDKREGALGLMAQHRRAVDRYFIVSIEWPGFMRNYFEHHRDTSDSLLNVYTNRPLRLALRLREPIGPHLWISAFGEIVPPFEMGDEVNATGEKFPREEADARALTGWVEYTVDPAKSAREQAAIGVQAGYERSTKNKDVECGCTGLDALAPPGTARRGGDGLQAVPQGHFGQDLYERTDDETVRAWRDERAFVSPYAWVPIGERVVLNATLRYEERDIRVRNDAGETDDTQNEYIVPRVGVSYALGRRRQYIMEAGLVSEFRKRTVEHGVAGSSLVSVEEKDFDDHRLYVAFEYAFGEANLVRLIEGFELDAEDRGQFGIHDHGFFQLIIGF